VLGGLTSISAARVGPGVVERFSGFQRVVVGEVAGGGPGRAERIAEALREAGAEAVVSGDIVAEVWRKFAFIASVAAACGLSRSAVGTIRGRPLGRLLIERAVREAVAVARARHVMLPSDEESSILQFIDGLPPGMKPSLLLDLEAGRPTEIDDLSGAVSRLGRRAGVETPVHDTATAALGEGRVMLPGRAAERGRPVVHEVYFGPARAAGEPDGDRGAEGTGTGPSGPRAERRAG